ncbi:MAG: guanylate kinase [Anaerolineae bacterium]|nr:guanylate kinase [Anaerolineae bacterium]
MTTPETSIFDVLHPEPLLIVISGPSGVGKDAIVQRLKQLQVSFHFVVTATSRDPRPGEHDGVDYHFISRDKFEEMIAQDELIEYASVYNQYKGIPKFEVRDAMTSGKDVVMRLDVQGAARIKQLCDSAILIFLIPENEAAWLDRFRARKTEDADSLALRMKTARDEIKCLSYFDYIVVNPQNKMDEAAETIIAIIKAEHSRTQHRHITL